MAWLGCAAPPASANWGVGAFVGDGTRLYEVGGVDDSWDAIATVYAYDPAADTWTACAPLPAPRMGGVVAFLDGKVYHLGGNVASWTPTATVYTYDPADDAAGWSELHALPFDVSTYPAAAAAGFAGKVYLVSPYDEENIYAYDPVDDATGWVPQAMPALSTRTLTASADKLYCVGHVSASYNATRRLYSYDLGAGWELVTTLPTYSYDEGIAVGNDGRLWYLQESISTPWSLDLADVPAGWRQHPYTPGPYGTLIPIGDYLYSANYQMVKTLAVPRDGRLFPDSVAGTTATHVGSLKPRIAELTPETGYEPGYGSGMGTRAAVRLADRHWDSLPSLPVNARYATAAAAAGRLYVFGGQRDYPKPAWTNAWVYDPADPGAGWVGIASLPIGYAVGEAVEVSGKVYAIGGRFNNGTLQPYARVYDPADDATGWVPLAAAPEGTTGHRVVTVGDTLFIVGGYDGSPRNTVLSLDTATPGAAWVSLPSLPSYVREAAVAAIDGLIYLAGGFGNSGVLADTWVYDPADPAAGWGALPSLPRGVFAARGANVDGVFHVMGITDYPASRVHYIFDPRIPELGWTTLAPLSRPMDYFNVMTVDADLYVVGGPTSDDVNSPQDAYVLRAPLSRVVSRTKVAAGLPAGALQLDTVYMNTVVAPGSSWLHDLVLTVTGPFRLDTIFSQTVPYIEFPVDPVGNFAFDVIQSRTKVALGGGVEFISDLIRSGTDVVVDLQFSGVHTFQLDLVTSRADVRIMSLPDLSRNAPILLAFTATMRLESVEPFRSGETLQPIRAVTSIVVQLPEPAVSDGRPSLPDHWAKLSAQAVLIEGASHIHAIADPNPVWDPNTSGWSYPPPPVSPSPGGGDGGGDFRWSVDSLPDPDAHSGNWYWLGDNGGGGAPAGAAAWLTSPGSPAGPAWRSFFPFRPSVHAYDAYVGGRKIHYSRGVLVNSHYAEHMWMDFGGSQVQPFTWVVVAMVMSDPFGGYQHNILDAGRNPNDVGFPRISASAVSTERRIADNLPYRTSLSVVSDTAQLTTLFDAPLRTRGAGGVHPRMYAAVVNGASSQLGVYDPFSKNLVAGSVRNEAASQHRFMVMGREQSWISQRHAANMMVFEIRYWHHALTHADLDGQYEQLSSTYQFDAFKRV